MGSDARNHDMKILVCASEAAPYAKSGGLADVIGALPAHLRARGHDVRLVLPRYGWVDRARLRELPGPLLVDLGIGPRFGALLEAPGVSPPTYFVEHNAYFDRPTLYGPPGEGYPDNAERFSFFSHAVLAACHHLQFFPDVIHANDWHTALVPVLLALRERGPGPLAETASVLTLHNVGYPGEFPAEAFGLTGLGWEHFQPGALERYGRLNLLQGGIAHATKITTVSPHHAWEITTREGGAGLDGPLRDRRSDLVGILNGVDTVVWDPRTDAHLPVRYGPHNVETGKAACKAHLQRAMRLPERPEVPLIGLVTRLTAQKGTDLVLRALPRLLSRSVQVCLLGAGDAWQEQAFSEAAQRHQDQLAVSICYDEPLAHLIEAGADFFLMPSRYEPCGLNQLYSQRYGTLPIVRAVGGLVDTVSPYVPGAPAATGFRFEDLSPDALIDAVSLALHLYQTSPAEIQAMVQNAMARDLGWDRAAGQYEAVFADAIAARRRAPSR